MKNSPLRDIERKYGLRPAVKGEEQREFDTARRVEYGRGNLKQQMKSTVRLLAEQYRFGSITEYRTLLNLYHVDLEERKGEANGKRWNGIVYTATDERGAWVGTPIKSSNLTPKGGFKFLQKADRQERRRPEIRNDQTTYPRNRCPGHAPRPDVRAIRPMSFRSCSATPMQTG